MFVKQVNQVASTLTRVTGAYEEHNAPHRERKMNGIYCTLSNL